MFLEYAKDGQLWTSTGSLDADTSDGVIDFKSHMWIEDSVDGGASDFIRSVNGTTLKRWLVAPEESSEIPLGWKNSSSKSGDTSPTLKLRCHCNTVQLLITRPNEDSLDATSPFPDLTHPSASAHTANPNNEPWYMSRDRKRYLAGTCACKSCRLALGFDITTWSFIPLVNIKFLDGSPIKGTNEGLDSDPRIAEMMASVTSPTSDGTKRHFCKKCGANVFWWSVKRARLIDVAVGLLDAPSGARAEQWLEWHADRVSFSQEGLNKGLIEGLGKGIKEWKESRDAEIS